MYILHTVYKKTVPLPRFLTPPPTAFGFSRLLPTQTVVYPKQGLLHFNVTSSRRDSQLATQLFVLSDLLEFSTAEFNRNKVE